MKSTEAIKEIMKEQNMTATALGKRIGKTQKVVSDRLRLENLSTDKLNEMLRALDYKIVLVPADTRLPKDSYEVE